MGKNRPWQRVSEVSNLFIWRPADGSNDNNLCRLAYVGEHSLRLSHWFKRQNSQTGAPIYAFDDAENKASAIYVLLMVPRVTIHALLL